jgi:hypothetical protein
MPIISSDHAEQRLQACRLPALNATLTRLTGGSGAHSTLVLYDHLDPEDPTATALVSIPLAESVGSIVTDDTDPADPDIALVFTTPVEAQVTAADEEEGSIPLSAAIFDPSDDLVMTLTLSLTGDGGEVEMEPNTEEDSSPVVRLYNGALARITSIAFEG